ncbi:MAG: cation diffusion facilitator family transporter [Synechococcus sp.]
MAPSHKHSHQHHLPPTYGRAFIASAGLNIGFVVTEFIYAAVANSVALAADALHNLGDVLGLGVAWVAVLLVRRPPSARFTYGLRRSSILAALFNATMLLLSAGAIAREALPRLLHPAPVAEEAVIVVAAIGVLVNVASALFFYSDRRRDLNIRGAFLHLASDALVSVGVAVTGAIVLSTGWLWIDPLVSLSIVIVIVVTTWGLLRSALSLSLDAVPSSIDPVALRQFLEKLPGVTDIHDLHVWAMSTTETALTVHLVLPEGCPGDSFLHELQQELHSRFGIDHITVQIETGTLGYYCLQAPEERV